MKSVYVLIPALLVGGCATIFEGTDQTITINTTPPGASCDITRKGEQIGKVSPTPGSIRVEKSKEDLSILCTKDRYVLANTAQSPKFVGTTFGNIVAGGLVGVLVDAATGANFTYPDKIEVVLAPVEVQIPVEIQTTEQK